MIQPSYIGLYKSGELEERVEKAYQILEDCTLCPHHCHVDRSKGELGYCKTGDKIRIASFGPHFGEEGPLVGSYGSGTIFFSGCNLRCVYCQNYDISQVPAGDEIDKKKLAQIMLSLQKQGCHNINFVTPSHMIHALLAAILEGVKKGLRIPIVYNSGGYDDLEVLQLLDGVVDIYMPDLKYADEETGLKYSKVERYMTIVKTALKEMHRQVGDLQIRDGLATKGLIIRHLILPENLAGTEEVINFIAQELSPNTYVNIMEQYYPAYKAKEYKELSRSITSTEFDYAIKLAKNAGLNLI
ncbi:putative pyruvate formate lyase activating enzyme [Orenia metallireducens]|uniref:Putative pyruvate formate lyase activating enzyme n=1 Tax=Orenia metallireducens TaxID=1413210 RepID=A0A285I193_9FIRM|nr:radical SAM protein [Orenia metallireducens]PRX29289.1 putative pyruvate formate lyase activating enzyme [Orenia metallireducens]SNY40711.1 putative pyruvate formate lyase activating enzyme [Orenia metallireducens]